MYRNRHQIDEAILQELRRIRTRPLLPLVFFAVIFGGAIFITLVGVFIEMFFPNLKIHF
jgi:hypothetical protein